MGRALIAEDAIDPGFSIKCILGAVTALREKSTEADTMRRGMQLAVAMRHRSDFEAAAVVRLLAPYWSVEELDGFLYMIKWDALACTCSSCPRHGGEGREPMPRDVSRAD